jgi:hypothetical protein
MMLIPYSLRPCAQAPVRSLLVAVLVLCSAGVDARLIRGSGRGGNAVDDPPALPGDALYLIPDSVELPPIEDPIDGLASYSRYSFDTATTTSTGAPVENLPIQVNHDYGWDCENNTNAANEGVGCFLQIAPDEELAWSGSIFGLPEDFVPFLPGGQVGGGDAPFAGLRYRWDLFVGDSTASAWSQVVSPVASLAEAFVDGALFQAGQDVGRESLTGCFDRRQQIGTAPVTNAIDEGGCYTLGLENSGLTGTDILAQAGGEDVFLTLTAQIIAPSGQRFVATAGDTLAGGNVLEIDFETGQITNTQVSVDNLQRYTARSSGLRIVVAEVPVPASGLLLVCGLALYGLRSRQRGPRV